MPKNAIDVQMYVYFRTLYEHKMYGFFGNIRIWFCRQFMQALDA